jgi:hypothetical protein
MDKYNARSQRGDIIEVREDGWYTGANARAIPPGNSVVAVPFLTFEQANQYKGSIYEMIGKDAAGEDMFKITKKHRFRLHNLPNPGRVKSIPNAIALSLEDKQSG